MSDKITLQNHLWRLPEYRALDQKRRKLASAVILEGQSLTAACKQLGGLHATREKRNPKLQACLSAFNLSGGPSPATESAASGDAVSIYDHARRIGELLGDPPTDPVPGCSDQVIILPEDDLLRREFGIRELPVHPTSLPADQATKIRERITTMRPADRHICQRCGSDAIGDTRCEACNAASGKESPYRRTVCDSCSGAVMPPGVVRGIHVLCPGCATAYTKTGKIAEMGKMGSA